MASNASAPTLPNPMTPMAFLPPDLAFQVTISIYILVGSSGVMVWDVLNNLYGDYLLLFKHRIGLPTIAYMVSRLASLAYVISSTVFETSPAGNCSKLQIGLDCLFPIAIPATALLFFFRLRAVFDGNRLVVGFFAFMWLAVLGGTMTVPIGVYGINIGPTEYCLTAGLAPYVAAAAIIPLVNDTLVFLAITWKLTQNSNPGSFKEGLKQFFSAAYMPVFSKALLQDGQVYYLTTVSTNLLTVIMLYINAVPIAYRTMFTVPNIMLMNIMACRVYRNTKFGIFRKNTAISSTSKMVSFRGDDSTRKTAGGTNLSIPLPSLDKGSHNRSLNYGHADLEMQGIEVTKTVERHDDDDSFNSEKDARIMV